LRGAGHGRGTPELKRGAAGYSLSLTRILVCLPAWYSRIAVARYSGGTGPVRIILLCAGAWILSPR
jgi:hypothetical protein